MEHLQSWRTICAIEKSSPEAQLTNQIPAWGQTSTLARALFTLASILIM